MTEYTNFDEWVQAFIAKWGVSFTVKGILEDIVVLHLGLAIYAEYNQETDQGWIK